MELPQENRESKVIIILFSAWVLGSSHAQFPGGRVEGAGRPFDHHLNLQPAS